MRNVFFRILAVFAVGALSTIGASALFGVKPWIAASVAGVLAVFTVVEELARDFAADGDHTEPTNPSGLGRHWDADRRGHVVRHRLWLIWRPSG